MSGFSLETTTRVAVSRLPPSSSQPSSSSSKSRSEIAPKDPSDPTESKSLEGILLDIMEVAVEPPVGAFGASQYVCSLPFPLASAMERRNKKISYRNQETMATRKAGGDLPTRSSRGVIM